MTAIAETTARSAEKYRVTRSHRNVAWTGLGALVVVVVLALFPYLVGAGTETILVQAFIILTLASMWNLLAGYAGLASVGQQAFVGLGAYFVLFLNIHNISKFTALPIAAVGRGVAALPMWWLVSRLRSGYFAIATWVAGSQLIVQPSAVFSVQWTAEMAFAVIIGGLGTIEGPILGTIVYMALQQGLQSYNAWYLIILGLLAMVIAIFARRGLWGLVDEHLHVRLFPVGYWLWDPASTGRRGTRTPRRGGRHSAPD